MYIRYQKKTVYLVALVFFVVFYSPQYAAYNVLETEYSFE